MPQRKLARRKSEQISNVDQLVLGQALERNPSENQWKRDGHRQDASPRQAHVHPPAQGRAFLDELLRGDMGQRNLGRTKRTLERPSLPEKFPAPVPIDSG